MVALNTEYKGNKKMYDMVSIQYGGFKYLKEQPDGPSVFCIHPIWWL